MDNTFLAVVVVGLVGVGIFLTLQSRRLLSDIGWSVLAVAVMILLFASGVIWTILTMAALVFVVLYAFRLMIFGRRR